MLEQSDIAFFGCEPRYLGIDEVPGGIYSRKGCRRVYSYIHFHLRNHPAAVDPVEKEIISVSVQEKSRELIVGEAAYYSLLGPEVQAVRKFCGIP